jgi:hypothetical protein
VSHKVIGNADSELEEEAGARIFNPVCIVRR